MKSYSPQDFLPSADLANDEVPLLPVATTPKERELALLFEGIFKFFCLFATLLPLVILAVLITNTLYVGITRLDIAFITGFPSRFASRAGIFAALVGTSYLMLLTITISLPTAIASAIYLEEYAKDSWLKHFIEINVSNLAGVPSVIFGLLGLELFVHYLGLGASLISGALTLSLLILPVVITVSRDSLKSIPKTMREAGLALGGSKLLVIMKVVLPAAMPQIMTGAILAIARAIGETAPIIVLGAATYINFLPNHLLSEFSALPLQIFQWVERPQAGFLENASSAIVVLLIILSIFNLIAARFRARLEPHQWEKRLMKKSQKSKRYP